MNMVRGKPYELKLAPLVRLEVASLDRYTGLYELSPGTYLVDDELQYYHDAVFKVDAGE